jgi:hypothetical protein
VVRLQLYFYNINQNLPHKNQYDTKKRSKRTQNQTKTHSKTNRKQAKTNGYQQKLFADRFFFFFTKMNLRFLDYRVLFCLHNRKNRICEKFEKQFNCKVEEESVIKCEIASSGGVVAGKGWI